VNMGTLRVKGDRPPGLVHALAADDLAEVGNRRRTPSFLSGSRLDRGEIVRQGQRRGRRETLSSRSPCDPAISGRPASSQGMAENRVLRHAANRALDRVASRSVPHPELLVAREGEGDGDGGDLSGQSGVGQVGQVGQVFVGEPFVRVAKLVYSQNPLNLSNLSKIGVEPFRKQAHFPRRRPLLSGQFRYTTNHHSSSSHSLDPSS
jgi:hypothetical protein